MSYQFYKKIIECTVSITSESSIIFHFAYHFLLLFVFYFSGHSSFFFFLFFSYLKRLEKTGILSKRNLSLILDLWKWKLLSSWLAVKVSEKCVKNRYSNGNANSLKISKVLADFLEYDLFFCPSVMFSLCSFSFNRNNDAV